MSFRHDRRSLRAVALFALWLALCTALAPSVGRLLDPPKRLTLALTLCSGKSVGAIHLDQDTGPARLDKHGDCPLCHLGHVGPPSSAGAQPGLCAPVVSIAMAGPAPRIVRLACAEQDIRGPPNRCSLKLQQQS